MCPLIPPTATQCRAPKAKGRETLRVLSECAHFVIGEEMSVRRLQGLSLAVRLCCLKCGPSGSGLRIMTAAHLPRKVKLTSQPVRLHGVCARLPLYLLPSWGGTLWLLRPGEQRRGESYRQARLLALHYERLSTLLLIVG